MSTRRLKRLIISPGIIPDLLRGGSQILFFPDDAICRLKLLSSDLPTDLAVIHGAWDFVSNSLSLVCESGEFEPVEAAAGTMYQLPILNVICKTEIFSAEEIGGKLQEANPLNGTEAENDR